MRNGESGGEMDVSRELMENFYGRIWPGAAEAFRKAEGRMVCEPAGGVPTTEDGDGAVPMKMTINGDLDLGAAGIASVADLPRHLVVNGDLTLSTETLSVLQYHGFEDISIDVGGKLREQTIGGEVRELDESILEAIRNSDGPISIV